MELPMDNPPDREVAVFNAALQLPAGQRAAYLDAACAGENALRLKIEALLRVHDEVGTFLENPTQEAGPSAAEKPGPSGTIRISAPPIEQTGERIGRYKLLQQIGEGGCGVVYMAEQEEPVRRKVALKVIKLGIDTKHVIARFEAERQALALMDHPNIAKVLDAGATDAGRPFFVMELVRGIKITDYCDENHLSTEERLKIFTQVCQAIQHAHQKGIIHRDIKPSNILVADHDGVPVPKVIDFGIAKATTDQRLTDKTLFTALEQFMGTPAYMSPEQARLSGLDIDTRTDIYSLGVLLYELLTGKNPFDAKDLLAAGLEEMRRTIREKEPQRPSTALSTMLAADLTTVARHRQSDAPKLVHLVRGDLDWIVMKALEKDRTRRYETANSLATDIQRHLDNEPVNASPPSSLYRLQKAIRRNKGAFAAAAVIAVVLLIGVVVSTSQAIRASRAEREQIQLRKQAQANEKQAKVEAAKSREVARFLEDTLRESSPWTTPSRDTSVIQEILDRTAERISVELTNEPEVELELRDTIGSIYREFAENSKAVAVLRDAPAKARKLWGDQDPRLADLLNNLALAICESNPTEAEKLDREVLAIYAKSLGNENMKVVQVLRELASGPLRMEGKLPEAESMFHKAMVIQSKLEGNETGDMAASLTGLASILKDQGRLTEAESLDREALRIDKMAWQQQTNPAVAAAYGILANDLKAEGKFAEAEPMFRSAFTMKKQFYGEDFLGLAGDRFNLAETLLKNGKAAEARPLAEAAVALGQRFPSQVDSGLQQQSIDLLKEVLTNLGDKAALEKLDLTQQAGTDQTRSSGHQHETH
jgi:serine/threonine protein kinase